MDGTFIASEEIGTGMQLRNLIDIPRIFMRADFYLNNSFTEIELRWKFPCSTWDLSRNSKEHIRVSGKFVLEKEIGTRKIKIEIRLDSFKYSTF